MNMGLRILLALIMFLLGMQVIKLVRRIVKKSLTRGKVDVGVRQFMDSLSVVIFTRLPLARAPLGSITVRLSGVRSFV